MVVRICDLRHTGDCQWTTPENVEPCRTLLPQSSQPPTDLYMMHKSPTSTNRAMDKSTITKIYRKIETGVRRTLSGRTRPSAEAGGSDRSSMGTIRVTYDGSAELPSTPTPASRRHRQVVDEASALDKYDTVLSLRDIPSNHLQFLDRDEAPPTPPSKSSGAVAEGRRVQSHDGNPGLSNSATLRQSPVRRSTFTSAPVSHHHHQSAVVTDPGFPIRSTSLQHRINARERFRDEVTEAALRQAATTIERADQHIREILASRPPLFANINEQRFVSTVFIVRIIDRFC